jgi:serine/threonine-protein kinase RsbW
LSAIKRMTSDISFATKNFMPDSEGNPNQPSKIEFLRPRKTVSATSEPTIFGQSLTDKPERIEPDAISPFLHERIALKMPSDIQLFAGVLDCLNERMLQLGLIPPGNTEVMLALDEAIVNAIKHGNKGDARKSVHMIAEFNAEGVRFSITDEGAGFDREQVPDPTDPCHLLETSGRGLLLIRHIMDEVHHNEAGNRVEMFKRCARSGSIKTDE